MNNIRHKRNTYLPHDFNFYLLIKKILIGKRGYKKNRGAISPPTPIGKQDRKALKKEQTTSPYTNWSHRFPKSRRSKGCKKNKSSILSQRLGKEQSKVQENSTNTSYKITETMLCMLTGLRTPAGESPNISSRNISSDLSLCKFEKLRCHLTV